MTLPDTLTAGITCAAIQIAVVIIVCLINKTKFGSDLLLPVKKTIDENLVENEKKTVVIIGLCAPTVLYLVYHTAQAIIECLRSSSSKA